MSDEFIETVIRYLYYGNTSEVKRMLNDFKPSNDFERGVYYALHGAVKSIEEKIEHSAFYQILRKKKRFNVKMPKFADEFDEGYFHVVLMINDFLNKQDVQKI